MAAEPVVEGVEAAPSPRCRRSGRRRAVGPAPFQRTTATVRAALPDALQTAVARVRLRAATRSTEVEVCASAL